MAADLSKTKQQELADLRARRQRAQADLMEEMQMYNPLVETSFIEDGPAADATEALAMATGRIGEQRLRVAARLMTMPALGILAQAIDPATKDISWRDRLTASKEVLDRGFGKSSQPLEVTTHDAGDEGDKLLEAKARAKKQRDALLAEYNLIEDDDDGQTQTK